MRIYRLNEFHNEVLFVRHLPSATVCIARRDAGTTFPKHAHEAAMLVMLLSGRHQWHGTDGKIHWSVPGAWYARAPGEIHSHDACPTEIECLGINFIPSAYRCPIDAVRGVIHSPEGIAIAKRMIAELKKPTAGGDHLLDGLLFQLVGTFVAAAGKEERQPGNDLVRRAKRLLDQDLSDPMEIHELAAEVGTHRSHLARLFRKHLGLTVTEYRRDRRLEFAYRRLLEGDQKIATIAAESGFADHAHFCRLFKSRFGLSPSEHRSKHTSQERSQS